MQPGKIRLVFTLPLSHIIIYNPYVLTNDHISCIFFMSRDHFWLNEGWTTWFQRKIMARMKNNPKFLDFDAIQGRKVSFYDFL